MAIRTKPKLSPEDQAWVDEQLATVPGPDDGYTDAQFEADLERAKEPLSKLAEKARLALRNGTAKEFPR